MSMLIPYRTAGSHDTFADKNLNSEQAVGVGPVLFVSLLEFVSEIYQVSLTGLSLDELLGNILRLIILRLKLMETV